MPIDRLHIGLLATVASFGGAEQVILKTIRSINRHRFRISPILFTRSRTTDNYIARALNESRHPFFLFHTDRAQAAFLNPLINVAQAFRVIRQNGIQIIHSHGYRADFLAGILATTLRIPSISTCHGFSRNDPKMKLYKTINGLTLRHFSRVIAVSPSLVEELQGMGVNPALITLLPNAMELPVHDSTWQQQRNTVRDELKIKDGFVVGYAGRLSSEKGLPYLMMAIANLVQKDFRVHAIIVGDGPQRAQLENMTKELGIFDRIHFVGFQNQVPRWLAALDAFVLPSTTEGTPMALLEAMAHGIPVIASAVGGIPSVISHGKEGLLVTPRNPAAIQEAIQNLQAGKVLSEKLIQEARAKIAKDYDLNAWINHIESLYTAVRT